MDPKRLSYFCSTPPLFAFLLRKLFLRAYPLSLLSTVIFMFGMLSPQAHSLSIEQLISMTDEELPKSDHPVDEGSTKVDDTLKLERISFAPRGDGMGM